MKKYYSLFSAILLVLTVSAQPWIPDLGNANYENPIYMLTTLTLT